MEAGSMQCHGCGSTNVSFDPQRRILICNQCGKQEYYSRATLNTNGKVLYAKQNALTFFSEGRYEQAKQYASDVLNISIDNAPALYILAYYDEFQKGKNDSLHSFFSKMENIALEYDETIELMDLFLASPYKLMEHEEEVIKIIAMNMQADEDAARLCNFFDKLCPYLISKWPSMAYLKPSLISLYVELAQHCSIPKTCFALINSIQKNPDSPYASNTFFLRPKTEYFYENFVIPIERVILSMDNEQLKQKFIAAYQQRKRQYKADSQ